MFFHKKLICICTVFFWVACQPSREGSVNFAGSEYWRLQPGETAHPLDDAIFSLYEKYQFLPSGKAPLSKYIHADRYNVFISLLSNSNARQLNQFIATTTFPEYLMLEKDTVRLSHQNQDQRLLYRYLLQKADTTYLYSTAYDTNKFDFSILINVITKDSSLAYQYFQNPAFMAQRLGGNELMVNN